MTNIITILRFCITISVLILIAPTIGMGQSSNSSNNNSLLCHQNKPFFKRTPPVTKDPDHPQVIQQWLDIGVPVDPDGDPGSGSFGSAPFGLTNELGIIFETTDAFVMNSASMPFGVNGSVFVVVAIYELDPGTTTRNALVALTTATSTGVQPFNINNRIYGSNERITTNNEFRWFDYPLFAELQDGKRYELVFSDFAIISGFPFRSNNWIYAHPLFDSEGRAFGQPYDACNLMLVVDGSLRGSRATGLPFALIKVQRTLGQP